MVAINGVPFDPNPPPFSRLYNRVQERLRRAVARVPRPRFVDRLASRVRIKDMVTGALSKFSKRRRKRKWGNLGKIKSFAVQEVHFPEKDVVARDAIEDMVEDKELEEMGSGDPV